MNIDRRRWLFRAPTAMWAARFGAQARAQQPTPPRATLDVSDYQPRTMLHVPQTEVPRARYPVIDVHTHLSFSARSERGVPLTGQRRFAIQPENLLPVMDRRNIRIMVNLTGGYGQGLQDAIARFDKAVPGRFLTFTEPAYARFQEPGYARWQAQAIEEAHRAGARGLKVLKTLGLYLRENITSGKLVAIDDSRFDPMWEACAAHNMPVAIHVSDPLAFFTPIDRFNERFEELNHHPDWSFYDRDYPSNAELLAARNRVLARHRKTQFIVLHVGNFAEDLANVSEALDRYPNMTVDIAARLNELGRQPRTTRRFFERYQDRILFGTDATPSPDVPQQSFSDALYQIYYRFLETEDEYFDYAPSAVPPQGRWRIYGIQLPDAILEKVYHQNAERVLGLS